MQNKQWEAYSELGSNHWAVLSVYLIIWSVNKYRSERKYWVESGGVWSAKQEKIKLLTWVLSQARELHPPWENTGEHGSYLFSEMDFKIIIEIRPDVDKTEISMYYRLYVYYILYYMNL